MFRFLVFVAAALSLAGADSEELRTRRRIAAASFEDGVVMIHATPALDDTFNGFHQDALFYYYTGLENTAGAILAIDGPSRESWLFLPTDPFYAKILPPEGSSTSDAVKRAAIEHVVDWTELEGFLSIRGTSRRVPLYFAAPDDSMPELPANLAPSDNKSLPLWLATIQQKWPAFQVRNVKDKLHALLDVQSASELQTVRVAASTTVKAVNAGIRAIRPGVTQHSVESLMSYTCSQSGAHGTGFWPWAMSGEAGVFPRPVVSFTRYDHLDRTMKAGDLVRIDAGCEVGHYSGDLGRTVPVSGKFTDEQREVWDIFVAAYLATVKELRDGATGSGLFDVWSDELLRHRATAKSALARQAIDEWSDADRVPYWQIHTINLVEGFVRTLRAGMTIALEPIMSIGGQGYYLEDMFLITKDGAELLTPGLPYTAAEIENAMAGN